MAFWHLILPCLEWQVKIQKFLADSFCETSTCKLLNLYCWFILWSTSNTKQQLCSCTSLRIIQNLLTKQFRLIEFLDLCYICLERKDIRMVFRKVTNFIATKWTMVLKILRHKPFYIPEKPVLDCANSLYIYINIYFTKT